VARAEGVVVEDKAVEAEMYVRYKPGEPVMRMLPKETKGKEITLPAVEDAVVDEEDALERALDGEHTPI
jgi:hypothetical protein